MPAIKQPRWCKEEASVPYKMSKKVLITGASGYLGKYFLQKTTSQNYNIQEFVGDITDTKDVQSNFDGRHYDVIVHFAAKVASSVDQETMMLTNYEATKNLVAAADDKTHFIFLSSDLVFNNSRSRAYRIGDTKDPQTLYGKSKHYAEEHLKDNTARLTIIRTSMLYGYNNPKRKNFLRFLYERLVQDKNVSVYTDVFCQPTHIEDLSNFIVKTIDEEMLGTYHAVGEERLNRYDLAKKFCETHAFNTNLLIKESRSETVPPVQLFLRPSKEFTKIKKHSLPEGLKYQL